MLNKDAIKALFDTIFPSSGIELLSVDQGSAEILMPEKCVFLRPGNSVAGPVLMLLADTVVYLAILGRFGEDGMHYVTSNLNIHFLARAHPGDITATARLVKAGSRLVVADVEIFDSEKDLVAKASVSYMAVHSAK